MNEPTPGQSSSRISWRPVAVHPLPASIVGVAGAFAIGLALVPFRETVGAVNAALAMAAIIVISAEFGGRSAGALVGAAGSISFNVLHTEPYLELVIADTSELIAAVLLVAFGILVGTWHRKPSP